MELEREFARQMRANGERVSSPRLAVFRTLSRKNDLAIPDLVAFMQQNGIDRATTYRTISLFRTLGMVRDVVAGGKRMIELTDSFRGHHHHFWCRNCGKLIDFDDAGLEKELKSLADRLGFQLLSHQLDISGLCANCKK